MAEKPAMSRKRKSEAAVGMDDADRALYSVFCGAANSLSHLYSKSLALQKQAFRAGELHALEKLSQWIRMKHAEGSRVTVADIMARIEVQLEMENEDSDAQVPQSARQLGNPTCHNQLAGSRCSNGERSKSIDMFSNDDLSSPVRQNYHPARAGRSVGNGVLNTSEANFATCSYDTAMDMV